MKFTTVLSEDQMTDIIKEHIKSLGIIDLKSDFNIELSPIQEETYVSITVSTDKPKRRGRKPKQEQTNQENLKPVEEESIDTDIAEDSVTENASLFS